MRRRHSAIVNALQTSDAVMRSAIAQLITRREKSSSTTAKYSWLFSVQIEVIYDTHF
jgi:hypothetical protein